MRLLWEKVRNAREKIYILLILGSSQSLKLVFSQSQCSLGNVISWAQKEMSMCACMTRLTREDGLALRTCRGGREVGPTACLARMAARMAAVRHRYSCVAWPGTGGRGSGTEARETMPVTQET